MKISGSYNMFNLPYEIIIKIPNNWASIKWRGTKKPLDESESGDWKVVLKLNIQRTEIMTSGPITSWEIDEETVETVTDFIFGGSKITADGECSHEIKRCLLLGRKIMTNLDSILKSIDIISWPHNYLSNVSEALKQRQAY